MDGCNCRWCMSLSRLGSLAFKAVKEQSSASMMPVSFNVMVHYCLLAYCCPSPVDTDKWVQSSPCKSHSFGQYIGMHRDFLMPCSLLWFFLPLLNKISNQILVKYSFFLNYDLGEIYPSMGLKPLVVCFLISRPANQHNLTIIKTIEQIPNSRKSRLTSIMIPKSFTMAFYGEQWIQPFAKAEDTARWWIAIAPTCSASGESAVDSWTHGSRKQEAAWYFFCWSFLVLLLHPYGPYTTFAIIAQHQMDHGILGQSSLASSSSITLGRPLN